MDLCCCPRRKCPVHWPIERWVDSLENFGAATTWRDVWAVRSSRDALLSEHGAGFAIEKWV